MRPPARRAALLAPEVARRVARLLADAEAARTPAEAVADLKVAGAELSWRGLSWANVLAAASSAPVPVVARPVPDPPPCPGGHRARAALLLERAHDLTEAEIDLCREVAARRRPTAWQGEAVTALFARISRAEATP